MNRMREMPDTRPPSYAPARPPPAIEITGLWKSFEDRPVFKGLSLSIGKGEAMAIIGGSGSGKSVLLKHIAGLLRPDRGTVKIDGLDLAIADRRALARVRMKLGYLFQDGALLNSMTLFDNVALPLRERSEVEPAAIRDRVMAHLELIGLADSAGKYPAELSGGMRKRAGLARALVTEPEIVLYDEPTSALDPLTGASIARLIRDLHQRLKVTSVLVTHDLALASAVADRIALLWNGKVHAVGTPLEIEESRDPRVYEFVHAGTASAL